MTSTEITRSKLQAALAPDRRTLDSNPDERTRWAETPAATPNRFSVVDCVSDGVDRWLHKSAIGRAAKVAVPLVSPYLKPLIRRHYAALLLGSAVAGALVSRYPARSARTVVAVAGPWLVSSLLYEISKAGLRQLKRRR